MLLTGIILRISIFGFASVRVYGNNKKVSLCKVQGIFGGVGKSAFYALFHDQAIDYNLHRMLLVFLKLRCLGDVVHPAVDSYSDIAVLFSVLKDFFVHTLFTFDNGSKEHKFCSYRKSADIIDDLIYALLLDFLSADRAVGNTDSRIHKSQIIVYFGDGADCRTGILRGGFLID